MGEMETNLSAQPKARWLSSLASGRPSLRFFLHGNDLLLAVGNQRQNSDNCKFASGTPQIHLDLLHVPNSISINAVPFPLTLTIHACTLKPFKEAAAAAKARKYNPLSLAHPPRGKGYLNLHAELYPLSLKMLEEVDLNVKQNEGTAKMNFKPTITPASLLHGPTIHHKAHSKEALLPSLDVHLAQEAISLDMHDHEEVHPLQCHLASTRHPQQAISPTPPQQNLRILGFQSDKPKPDLEKQERASPSDSPLMIGKCPNDSTDLISQTQTQVPPLLSMPQGTVSMQPKGRQPTRRSQRIKDLRRPINTPSKPSKPKSKVVPIPFLPNSQQTPLQAEETMQILQASGLLITKEVEDMIQEAINLDGSEATAELPRPQTPLHDLIPPGSCRIMAFSCNRVF